MGQFTEIEVFDNKNLSDIFQEIYQNHETKKSEIKSLVEQLVPLIEGIGDATLLVPLIKEYIELGIKNDDQLVKLAQIVQRLDSSTGKKNPDFDFNAWGLQDLLTEDQNISKEIQNLDSEVKVAVPVVAKN